LLAITAERPAQIYGVYPRKGSIKIGSDADMVIVDMDKEVTIKNENQITACGWTAYDGMKVKGWPVMSIIRGEVVMEDDQVLSKKGFGEFISREF
jgi:dihydropyrimidinase